MHRYPPLFLTLVLVACGTDTGPVVDPGLPPVVQRLRLEPLDPRAERPIPRTVRSWVVGEDGLPDGFTVAVADSAEVRSVPGPPGGEPLAALVLGGSSRAELQLADHGPGPVHRVVVSASVRGGATFSPYLRVKDRPLVKLGAKTVVASGEWNTLTFDLSEPVRADERLVEVGLNVYRNKKSVAIASVSTVEVPWAAMLPAPGSPEVTSLGDFARPAVGLVPEAPLRTSVSVVEPSVVELSFAVPPRAHGASQDAELVVTLEGDGGVTRTERYPLVTEPVTGDPWQFATVSMASFVGQTLTATFAVEGAPLVALGPPRLRRPVVAPKSVVLITSDTHRADHVGLNPGGVDVETPFLDRLAGRGLYFTDCWTSTNVTNPSHVALMTGTAPSETGVIDNTRPLSSRAETLAERFRDAGYLTWAAVSVSHLGPDRSGLGQGFDRVCAPGKGQVDSELAIDVLDGWLAEAEGAPLFLWLHVFDAHEPYLPPDEFVEPYYDLDENDPYDDSRPELREAQRVRWDPVVRDVEYVRARYKGEVSYLDRQLERFLSHERLAGGVVAFTSDHGESLGQHDIWFGHAGLYPETLSVPLILAWPGGPTGEICDRPVRQIDLGRTLLNLQGLGGEAFPGRDLVELARAEAVDVTPRFALADHGLSASIQLGRWFLVLHLRKYGLPDRDEEIERHSIELYDLEADPGCVVDLADGKAREVRRLRERLVGWLLEAPDEGLVERGGASDAADLEDLAAMGYATGSAPVSTRWFDAECGCRWCARFE